MKVAIVGAGKLGTSLDGKAADISPGDTAEHTEIPVVIRRIIGEEEVIDCVALSVEGSGEWITIAADVPPRSYLKVYILRKDRFCSGIAGIEYCVLMVVIDK